MQFRKFVPILFVLAILLAACSQTRPTSDAALKDQAVKTAMTNAGMATVTPNTMMGSSQGMMSTATPATMMSGSQEMMSTATPDTMMSSSQGMMSTATPATMMSGSQGMMSTATPDSMMGTPGTEMMVPAWFSTSLINVATQETFTINSLIGKVILVEPMAQWCTTCLQQQKQVIGLHTLLGANSGFVSLGLDIDPNEDSASLNAYIEKHSYNWVFAVAPAEVSREIGNLLGSQFLNPPSAPMFIIDRHGALHPLPFGVKSAEDLQKAIQPYLNDAG